MQDDKICKQMFCYDDILFILKISSGTESGMNLICV